MKLYTKLFLTIIFCLIADGAVFAADTPIKGRLSLGYSDTKGNTEESKVNFAYGLSETKHDALKLNYNGLVLYGKANDQKNADKKQFGVTSEFKKSVNNSYYLSSGYMTDEFAGYDSQVTFGFGYMRYFERCEEQEFKVSLGLDFTNEKYTTGKSHDEKWLKAGLSAKKRLAENIRGFSVIDYSIPSEESKDNYKVDASIGTLFNVNSKFDMEMKYTISYRQTPVDGYKRQDNGFYTSLVYKI